MNDTLRSSLQQVMDAFHLPGMAVVVIQQGEVVANEGFGYANIEEEQPFTEDTRCLIASVTKSFTASLTGCLVDKGVVEWTKPVRHYIAGFKMMDEFATKEITLADMLCHRSGLPYHENLLTHGVDRELPDSGRVFRADLLKRLAYFDPSSAFRTHYQYQDIVYTCVGAILEHITGQAYETLVEHYLLEPLGLTSSTFVRAEARQSGRLAQGYAFIDDTIQRIPFCDTRYIAPSAGLYSTARDLARWLQLQLSQGRFENRQIISEESLAWIHRGHMLIPSPSGEGDCLPAYGHGWRQNSLHGHTTICHGGSFNGYRTFVGFLPKQEAGVVILTNLNLTEGSTAAGMVVLDALLNVEAVAERISYHQARFQWYKDMDKQAAQDFEAGRDRLNPATYDLKQYQGNYHHPGYGEFTISLQQGDLYQSYDGRGYPLVAYDGNTFASKFQSTENRLLDMTFTFESDAQGNVVACRVPLIPDIPTPRFVKE